MPQATCGNCDGPVNAVDTTCPYCGVLIAAYADMDTANSSATTPITIPTPTLTVQPEHLAPEPITGSAPVTTPKPLFERRSLYDSVTAVSAAAAPVDPLPGPIDANDIISPANEVTIPAIVVPTPEAPAREEHYRVRASAPSVTQQPTVPTPPDRPTPAQRARNSANTAKKMPPSAIPGRSDSVPSKILVVPFVVTGLIVTFVVGVEYIFFIGLLMFAIYGFMKASLESSGKKTPSRQRKRR